MPRRHAHKSVVTLGSTGAEDSARHGTFKHLSRVSYALVNGVRVRCPGMWSISN